MNKVRRTVAVLAASFVAALLFAGGTSGAGPIGTTPGYWLAGGDGGVFSFDAPFYGSGSSPVGPCVFSPQPPSTLDASLGCGGIASTPAGDGYWLLARFRYPTAFGRAAPLDQANCGGYAVAGGAWTGMTSTPTGGGFSMTSANGAVVGCGDATFSGGLESQVLAAPVVGIATTTGTTRATGWSRRTVGCSHSATRCSAGPWVGPPLYAPVVGMAAAPDGNGYWLAAADGGVFAFGSAPFDGSMGGKPMRAPVVGIAAFAGAVPG